MWSCALECHWGHGLICHAHAVDSGRQLRQQPPRSVATLGQGLPDEYVSSHTAKHQPTCKQHSNAARTSGQCQEAEIHPTGTCYHSICNNWATVQGKFIQLFKQPAVLAGPSADTTAAQNRQAWGIMAAAERCSGRLFTAKQAQALQLLQLLSVTSKSVLRQRPQAVHWG